MSKDEKFNLAVGARMRSRRTELGITIETLSAKVNVSISQLAKYENGVNTMPANVLAAIARGLKCKSSDLVGDRETRRQSILSAEAVSIANAFDELETEPVRDFVRRLVRDIKKLEAA